MNREDYYRRDQDPLNRLGETEISSWHPHHHEQHIPKSTRTFDEITPKGYVLPNHPSAGSKRRARPPPQVPQPPPPSAPPPYPLLHLHPPPPPPHPPPIITRPVTFSKSYGKSYSGYLNSDETCREHPKSKVAQTTSRPHAAHDADSKRGTSPGQQRPAVIFTTNGKKQDMSMAAPRGCHRRKNTAAANPADDTLQSKAVVLGNSGSDHPHCGFNLCYTGKLRCYAGKLRCQDKVARPDANTEQGSCYPDPCQSSFTHQTSVPYLKRPDDPSVMVGGCGKGGDLSWQTSGEHVKRHARKKHQARVNEASFVASSPHDKRQTDPTSRRPLCQLQRISITSSVSRDSTSRRGSCIADYLLLAEQWLAKSQKERLHSLTDGPDPLKGAYSLTDSALGQSTTSLGDQVRPLELKTRGTAACLRGKAAAEWAAGEARRRDEEQMTGTPKITRLGRNKRRSVDDLFLFKRTADTARRRNQDDRVAREENLNTGRPVSKQSPFFSHTEL